MRRYQGGERVQRGTYLAYPSLEFINIAQAGEALPAMDQGWYIYLPRPLMLVAGPLLGLAFIIFLPLIGIAAVLGYVGQRLAWPALRASGRVVAETVLVPVQVGYARFTGRARPVKRGKTEEKPAWEREVEEIAQGKKE